MIPNPVIKRLPKYLAYVKDLLKEGVQWASSHDIAEALGLTSSTVRQDLSHVDLTGISKKGYETQVLVRVLSEALGANLQHTVVIVGAGNLGCALAERGSLAEHNFKICGLFDNNPDLKGKQVGRLKISPMKQNYLRVLSTRFKMQTLEHTKLEKRQRQTGENCWQVNC